jgi:hypothetical protein
MPDTYNEPGSLMKETLRLLQQGPKTTLGVYRETGVPYHWLQKFIRGEIPNPGANRIQFLYEYLTGTSLAVGETKGANHEHTNKEAN